MAYGERTTCKACGREIVQLGGGHRQRQYCDENCRQAGFRQRQEDKRREKIRLKWQGFTPETQTYLDWLMSHYGEDLAQGVAQVIRVEVSTNRCQPG